MGSFKIEQKYIPYYFDTIFGCLVWTNVGNEKDLLLLLIFVK